jgi:hypothetical protein
LPLRQAGAPPPTLKNGALPTKVRSSGTSRSASRKRSSWRVLTTRASQELGVDVDPHSPYPTCETEPEPES